MARTCTFADLTRWFPWISYLTNKVRLVDLPGYFQRKCQRRTRNRTEYVSGSSSREKHGGARCCRQANTNHRHGRETRARKRLRTSSLADIARVRRATGNLYYYFKTKDAIGEASSKKCPSSPRPRAPGSGAEPRETVVAFIQATIDSRVGKRSGCQVGSPVRSWTQSQARWRWGAGDTVSTISSQV